MLWTLLALSLAPSATVPVNDLPNVRLSANSAAVISRSGDGYLLSADASGKLLAGEREMLDRTLERPNEAMGPNAVGQTTDLAVQPLVPSTLRFSLIDHHGEMVLTILNGLPQSVVYKARIGRGSESMMTDVCQVLPNKRGVEHWPYHFDWIEITELKPVAYREGDPPSCE